MSSWIQDLPRPCVVLILAYCDCESRFNLRSVCRGFRRAFDGESSLQCCLWQQDVQSSQLLALSRMSEGISTLLLPHCLHSCSLEHPVQPRHAEASDPQPFSSLQHLVVNYRLSSLVREMAEAAGSALSSVTITKGRGGTRKTQKLCRMLQQLQQVPQLRHLHMTLRLPPTAAELLGQLKQLQSLRLSIPTHNSSNGSSKQATQGFMPESWGLAVSSLTALTRLQCTMALYVHPQEGLPLQQLQQLRCLQLNLLQLPSHDHEYHTGVHAADSLLSNLPILPHLTKLSLVAAAQYNWLAQYQGMTPGAFERLGLLRELRSLELGLAYWQMNLQELQPLSACRHLTELVLPELVMSYARHDHAEQMGITQLTPEELAAVAAGLAAAAAAAAGTCQLDPSAAAGGACSGPRSGPGPVGQVSSVTVFGSSQQVPLLPGLKRLVCRTMWWRLPLVVVAPALLDVSYKRLRNLGRGNYVLPDLQQWEEDAGGALFGGGLQELLQGINMMQLDNVGMALLDGAAIQGQAIADAVDELPAGQDAAPGDGIVPGVLLEQAAGAAAAGATAEAEVPSPSTALAADSQQFVAYADGLPQAPDAMAHTADSPSEGSAAGFAAVASASASSSASSSSAAAAAAAGGLGYDDGASAVCGGPMPKLASANPAADDINNTAGAASWPAIIQQDLEDDLADLLSWACPEMGAASPGTSSAAAAAAAAAAADDASGGLSPVSGPQGHDRADHAVHSLSCPLPCPLPAEDQGPFSASTSAAAAQPVAAAGEAANAPSVVACESADSAESAEAVQDEPAGPAPAPAAAAAAAAPPPVSALYSLQEAPMSKCYADVLRGQASLRKVDVCVPALCKIVQLSSQPLATLQELSLHMLGEVKLPPGGLPFLPCLTCLEFYLPDDRSWEDDYNDDEDIALWQNQHSVKQVVVRGTYHGGGFFAPKHLTLAAAVMPKLQLFTFVNCRDLRVEKLQRVVDSKVAPVVEVVMAGIPPSGNGKLAAAKSSSTSHPVPDQPAAEHASDMLAAAAAASSRRVADSRAAACSSSSSSQLSSLDPALPSVGSSSGQCCQELHGTSAVQSAAAVGAALGSASGRIAPGWIAPGRIAPDLSIRADAIVTKAIVQAMARSASAAGASVQLKWIDHPVAWAPWLQTS